MSEQQSLQNVAEGVAIWGLEDNTENSGSPQRVSTTSLGGGKVGLDVNVAGAVSLTANFTDYITSFTFATVAVDGTTAVQLSPIANQVVIRIVPKFAGKVFYAPTNAVNATDYESFDKDQPISIQTNASVYIIRDTGAAAGNVAVYRGVRV